MPTCPDALTYLEYCQLTGLDPAASEAAEVRVRALIAAVTRNLELILNCRLVVQEYVEPHYLPYAPTPYPCLSLDPVYVERSLILHQRPVQAVLEVKDFAGTVVPGTVYHLVQELALLL